MNSTTREPTATDPAAAVKSAARLSTVQRAMVPARGRDADNRALPMSGLAPEGPTGLGQTRPAADPHGGKITATAVALPPP
ncbi:hypothetical protein [Streptomyces canus]|uniref:hypothetical protein n=1 Tax=Streptomyces canus TaxID=58343 RepID=UPI0036E9EC1B